MAFEIYGFDWDSGNIDKCAKHGVSRDEIEEALRGEISVFPDPAHSQDEERFLAIGKTSAGRHLFMVFTLRVRGEETWLRPISARFMHAEEIAHYEKQAPET